MLKKITAIIFIFIYSAMFTGCFENNPTTVTNTIRDTLVVKDTIKVTVKDTIRVADSSMSGNLLKWVVKGLGETVNLQSIAYGNNRFVVVGSESDTSVKLAPVFTSLDGYSWKRQDLDRSYFRRIEWAGDRFFVLDGVNRTERQLAYSSSDGTSWKKINEPLEYVAYGNGVFIGLSNDFLGKMSVKKSIDGFQWLDCTLPQEKLTNGTQIAFGNDKFVIVCLEDDRYRKTLISSNGDNWSLPVNAIDHPVLSPEFINEQFVDVSLQKFLTSMDGINWESKPVIIYDGDKTIDCPCIAYGNQQYMIVHGDGTVIISKDREEWILQAPNLPAMHPALGRSDLAYGDGKFILCFGSRVYVTKVN
jgi:hypothetical protein